MVMDKGKKARLDSEKRRAERVRLPLFIKYKVRGKRAQLIETGFENISGLGLKIFVAEPLSIKDKVDIVINPQDRSPAFYALCKVCWCKEVAKDKFQAGLEFVKIKDRSRFIEFLCDKMLSLVFGQE